MSFLNLDLKKIFYLFFFTVACVAIYTLQQSRGAPSFPLAPYFLSHPIQNGYNIFADSISKTTRQYLELTSLRTKLRESELANQELKAQLQTLSEATTENERLRKLIELKDTHPAYKVVAAKVTAKDLFSDHFSLYINKGSDDGIEKLEGVISPEGVVGYIIDVQNDSSRLLLLNDRSTSIDATVQRTRSRGIIAGYSTGECILKFIDRPQEITQGDIVVTSSDQKIFPAGYPIGQVTSVHISPSGVGHYALVKPAIDLKKLEEILILKAKSP